MKKFILVVVLIQQLGTVLNAQTLGWAQGGISNGTSEGYDICTDVGGNVIITGSFAAPNIVFGSYTLNSIGSNDIYLVKYDNNGNIVWCKSEGGSGLDQGRSVSTDANGNIFLAGITTSSLIVFGTYSLSSGVFLVKYDNTGNVLWAINNGGSDVYSVFTDAAGNSYMLENSGLSNISVLKYNTGGTLLWNKSVNSNSTIIGYGICADASGNVLVTGCFYASTVSFGTFTLNNGGGADLFVTKYNSAGVEQWAELGTGQGTECGRSITTDNSGNIYITGNYTSTLSTFGSFSLSNSNPGNSNTFILKYDANGNALWAKKAEGTGMSVGYSACATSNSLFISLSVYSGTTSFDSFTVTPPNNAVDPMCVAAYDLSGTILGVLCLGSGGDDQNAISADGYCNVYASGDFAGSSFIVGTTTLTQPGTESIFTTKITYTCNSITGISSALYDSNNLSVYPNPVCSGNNVHMYNTENYHSARIHDVAGRIIELGEIPRNMLPTEGLMPGIYFITFFHELKESKTIKLIVY